MIPTLATEPSAFDKHNLTAFPSRDEQVNQIPFVTCGNNWADDSLQHAANLKQQQSSTYSQLRVTIPSSNSIVSGDAPSPTASAGTCSGASTPSLYRMTFVGGLLTGRLDAAEEAAQQQQYNFGPSSSGSAARRLLPCDCDDHAGVSNWLDQQISMRENARAPVRSFSGPAGSMETTNKEVAEGFRRANSNRVLPPPAFQLLGLL